VSILTTAENIINGQRAKDYGDAKENHERIASLWNAYLQKPDMITHEDVAVMMILLKIARFMENGYHEDTVVDIAGYAGVLEKMQTPKDKLLPTKDEPYSKPTPRVWYSLTDIEPDDFPLKLKDVDGDELFVNKNGRVRYYSGEGVHYPLGELDGFGPYTEVL
jgi:hypothetical protein